MFCVSRAGDVQVVTSQCACADVDVGGFACRTGVAVPQRGQPVDEDEHERADGEAYEVGQIT